MIDLESTGIEVPKIFISYSWTTTEHEEWVHNLAIRLVGDGVDVILDKWSLKDGNDINSFMEKIATLEDLSRVLIICDKGYMNKANHRSGGVGKETQIITPEVYEKADQEKFIPVVAEKDENGQPCLPVYLKTRKYIDMSQDYNYEEGYEFLLRNIFNRPMYRKPSVGTPPPWLFEDKKIDYKVKNISMQLQERVLKYPEKVKGISKNFQEAFFEALEEERITEVKSGEYLDELIVNSIENMKSLRDEYIRYVELQCEAYEEYVDPDSIVEFFEKLYKYTEPGEDIGGTYRTDQFDNFKFLLYELFLYTIIIVLDYGKYKTVSEIINGTFFIKRRGEVKNVKFGEFRFYLRSLDEDRKRRLNSTRLSLVADLLVTRASLKKYTKNKIVEIDLFLHYISILNGDDIYDIWFPATYIYDRYCKVLLLAKLVSKRHFSKIKSLFLVNTEDELRRKIEEFVDPDSRGYNNTYAPIPSIKYHIEADKICTML